MTTEPLTAGVYGVGRMGGYHARVYDGLSSVDLACVYDADEERAASVAAEYNTSVCSPEQLFETVDVLSIAVPTPAHYEVARRAIEHGVHVLIEKPFVENLEQGSELLTLADEHDVVLQVGHIERFNPAIRTLADIVPDLDVIAVDARRLGPPIDREVDTSVALDLMIHDIDVVLDLVDARVESIDAVGTDENRYVSSTITFENGVVGSFQASRVTQQKVRELSITARDCKVNVDYIDRSVRIHRHSVPEYIESNGSMRYRHESIIEQPTVENGEPLKKEIESFLGAVRDGTRPVVTGVDGLRALAVARRIDELARSRKEPQMEVLPHGIS